MRRPGGMDNEGKGGISPPMTGEIDTDVVIAGGGLVGGALALALAQAGLRSVVCDPAPGGPEGVTGRSYSLNLSSVRMLKALGLWDALEPDAQPILDIYVSDERPGRGASPLHLHFDHREIGEGPMGHMVEDRHLRPALDAALDGEPRIGRRGTTVKGLDLAPAGITASADAPIRARLLVAADGRGGHLPEDAGIRRQVKPYGQTSLTATLGTGRDHGGAAHQMFRPAGPLALLPLRGRRIGVVWTETADEAGRVAALPDHAFLDHLRPVVGGLFGDLTLEGGRAAWPLTLVLAERLVAERVALAGDAAHGLHPIAGQGLNAGLKDAAALAEALRDARRSGIDIGSRFPLETYQRWRRFDAASMAMATDGVNALFSNASPALRGLRAFGLGAVNAVPPLKRALIREAAGLAGDLPLLMRGEPLGAR